MDILWIRLCKSLKKALKLFGTIFPLDFDIVRCGKINNIVWSRFARPQIFLILPYLDGTSGS